MARAEAIYNIVHIIIEFLKKDVVTNLKYHSEREEVRRGKSLFSSAKNIHHQKKEKILIHPKKEKNNDKRS